MSQRTHVPIGSHEDLRLFQAETYDGFEVEIGMVVLWCSIGIEKNELRLATILPIRMLFQLFQAAANALSMNMSCSGSVVGV